MFPPEDDFYVGYVPESPRGIGRRTVRVTALLLCAAAMLGLTFVTGQSRFDRGTFEWGVEKTFEGVVVEKPYPMLVVSKEGGPETLGLVAAGKRGAGNLVAGLDTARVRVLGSRIYNDRERVIEVHGVEVLEPSAAGAGDDPTASPGDRPLGTMTLVGEIVDSKCHFGAMKPGRGKPHKACAIRCISGGVPPVLRVEDRLGEVRYFLLVSRDGKAVNREVLSLVAEPVEITGEVSRVGDKLILAADPSTYRRIDG